ncbi:MAG: C45 family autoproteolytic acyltransferase/hydrolase [bacterium]
METIDVPLGRDGTCDWGCLGGLRHELRDTFDSIAAVVDVEWLARNALRRVEIAPWMLAEAEQVARLAALEAYQVLAINALYDFESSRFGCTAFAVPGARGPIHSHCLDWEIGGDIIRRLARTFRYFSPEGDLRLMSVGWPGLMGVYVGVAPGRFSVTLNAVWSEYPPVRAVPVGMMLRRRMAATSDFEELVAELARTELACSCLLLVAGAQPGESVVVERTPRESGMFGSPGDRPLVVTNHYQVLQAGMSRHGYVVTGEEPFGLGTRERLMSAKARLGQVGPRDPSACHALLDASPFTNELTVLRTTMCAASGELRWNVASVEADGPHGDPA